MVQIYSTKMLGVAVAKFGQDECTGVIHAGLCRALHVSIDQPGERLGLESLQNFGIAEGDAHPHVDQGHSGGRYSQIRSQS